MKVRTLDSKDDLAVWYDELLDGVRRMLKRTGEHGQTPERLMQLMIAHVGRVECFLVICVDDDDKFQGFLFALLATPWVEVVALYTKPRIAVLMRDEVFNLLRMWGRGHGADRIITAVTRSPEKFTKFFHEPLGFKRIGFLMEARI